MFSHLAGYMTLVTGFSDCYFAQGLPWLIPIMPREASHLFIHS